MSFHTACLLLLITFWAIILYSYGHPMPPNQYGLDYNSYKPHYRHQRSFGRVGYQPDMYDQYQGGVMDRSMYRRSAMFNDGPMYGPPMTQYEEPMYPSYSQYPPPRGRDESSLIVLPRGADEDYEMYPLKTKTLDGFDAEDEDMMHEEEMGDALTLIDQQAPTRFIPETIAKKPKSAPSFQMEMATSRPRSYSRMPPVLLPPNDFQYEDEVYPAMPHHPQKRYQPNYQYYHPQAQDPYYQPRYLEPEPMYSAPTQIQPRRMSQPKRKPIQRIPEPELYDLEEEIEEILDSPIMDYVENYDTPIDSEEQDIMVKIPIISEEVIEEYVEPYTSSDTSEAIPDEQFFNKPDPYFVPEQETQEEETTVMPVMPEVPVLPKVPVMPKVEPRRMERIERIERVERKEKPKERKVERKVEKKVEIQHISSEDSETRDEIMQDTRSTQESSQYSESSQEYI